MALALGLLLTAAIDGNAALRHAGALASLGPHTWGSPRNEAAALYVASQLREAGLDAVELQRFERQGTQGTNVVATLRAPGEEIVLVAAHHDTAPLAPGAYDDGGGVGVLIELARLLASEPRRARTFVFAVFDGEEAEVLGKGQAAGSHAYLERLGVRSGSLVAVFDLEMCGWSRGRPLLHPIAYPDPRRVGGQVIAPGWLVRAALAGSREAGAELLVGDPYLSWLYQPLVRTFRVRLYGDDLSFQQAGRPALMAADSSFSTFYPYYHAATDSADRLDPVELERMGRAAYGALRALDRVAVGPADDAHWFAAFGHVIGWSWILGLGALSMLPVAASGLSGGALPIALRFGQLLLFGVLLWREPVPAVWVFLLPNLLTPLRRRWWTALISLLPVLALVGFGVSAWWRGAVNGVWLQPWEIAVALLALALATFALPQGGARAGRSRGRTAPGLPRRRGR
jgi:hypothetical protein